MYGPGEDDLRCYRRMGVFFALVGLGLSWWGGRGIPIGDLFLLAGGAILLVGGVILYLMGRGD